MKLFYEESLAPFATHEEGSFKADVFTRKDFDQMSKAKLQWYLSAIPHIEELPSEDLISLNKALHANEIPLEFLNRFESKVFLMEVLDQNKDLMVAYLLQNPFFACFATCEEEKVWHICEGAELPITKQQVNDL